ncbi:MAG TPA: hypothetical protein VFG10_15810 [Saprospiraceae bacterium]|nr:hypothetical protein [Saprospiraceae bacterium]
MDYLRYILFFTELVAMVAGFVYWDKVKNTPWKWFPVYLFFIFLFESTGELLIYFSYDDIHLFMYDYIVIPMQFIFLYTLFYLQDRNENSKKWLIFLSSVYFASLCFEKIFLTGANDWFNQFSYTIGVIGLVMLAIRYFDKLVHSESLLLFKSDMMFWVASGILFFYLGTLPFYGVPDSLKGKMPHFMNMYWIATILLDMTMYILFTLGFIWKRQK